MEGGFFNMILVTLGTQDKPFKRLLDKVEEQIEKGNIKEEVIVQSGYTKYESKNMKIFDLIDRDEFNDLISKCNLLITHGGVGSILTGLKNNKKIIVCPRLEKYKEHLNDHQTQIVDRFEEAGYILSFNEDDDLELILKKVVDFNPQKYESNTLNFVKIIEEFIANN